MTRYYTVCAFTPSSNMNSRRGRRSEKARLYTRAPNGFLFHDTLQALDISDLRLPMRYLSELFENAKAALVVRVNDNTLALTYSFTGMPTPINLLTAVYHGRSPYRGAGDGERDAHLTEDLLAKNERDVWVIADVNDPRTSATKLPLVEAYDHCLQLMRHTGNCPCPMATTGECVKTNVLPRMPAGFTEETVTTFFEVDQTALRRVRYENLNGFGYVSGKATDDDDFASTFRPWEDYDFSKVAERSVELRARGVARHLRNVFKDKECRQCVYRQQYAHRPDVYEACVNIRSCEGHVVEADAWMLLYNWLHKQSDFMAMSGFSHAERNYLIRKAGSKEFTRVITPQCNTATVYGGFILVNDVWKYRMVPAGGNTTRHHDASSYAEMRALLPMLPATPECEDIPVQTLLACAIFGNHPTIYLSGKGSYLRRYVKLISDTMVETVGANTRYETSGFTLGQHSPVKDYTCYLWGYQFGSLAGVVKKLSGASGAPDVSVSRLLESSKYTRYR